MRACLRSAQVGQQQPYFETTESDRPVALVSQNGRSFRDEY